MHVQIDMFSLYVMVDIYYIILLLLYGLNSIFSQPQERQRKLAEEQRNLIQQQAQAKAQMLRYEDELTRKRMQVIWFWFIRQNKDELAIAC